MPKALLGFAIVTMLLAQGTMPGSLEVSVKDIQGGSIPGVTIHVTKLVSDKVTGGLGTATFDRLEPGRYEVSANLDGFREGRISNIEVGSSRTSIPLLLEMKTSSEYPVVFQSELDPQTANDRSEVLASFGEPPLCSQTASKDRMSYRLLWLRSFHKPVFVAVERQPDGSSRIKLKTMTRARSPRVDRSTTRMDDASLLAMVNAWADHAEFWSMPAASDQPGLIFVDGARWTLEGIKDGQCRVVDRFSPGDTPFRAFCLNLIQDLGKLKLYYDEVY